MKNNYTEVLRDSDLKVTPIRFAILNAFPKNCHPISAEEIFKKIKTKIDLVTVYRTLNSFEEKGIIKKVDLRKDAIYYELNNDHHHHHIVCTSCGDIEEFELCDVPEISKKVLRNSSKFKNIDEHSFELFGVCKSCLKE